MPLSNKQVGAVARLARLNLTPSELEQFSHELTRILDYIDQLQKVDTSGVEPSNRLTDEPNNLRDDIILPSLPRKMVLENSPDHDDEYLHVPKVIEK